MSSNAERVKQAIIEIWSEAGRCTQQEVARATGAGGRKPLSQTTVRNIWTRWEEQGVLVTQVGRNGRPGAAYAFRWGAPPDATLRDVVANALQESALPAGARSNLRTAMRNLIRARYQAPDELILEACAAIPANQLYDVPDRVYRATLARGASQATATNLRSVVRRAMRLAAEQGVVPVIFPRVWDDDAWEVAKWTYFSNDAEALKKSTIRTYRAIWEDYSREVRELFGEEIRPQDVTLEMVEQLKRHLITHRGKRYLARQIGTVLSYIGRVHGVGPYAEKWSRADVVRGYNGRANAGYLVDARGRAASDGNWEVFIGILRDHGLPDEWEEFFRWYYEYSTLPDTEIEEDDRFPIRPDRRELRARTLVKRIVAVRAWGYQAIRLLSETEGLRPHDITLAMAFGEHGDRVARRLRSWWAERAERGEVTDRTSAGLVDILKGGMMIARALYDRSRHERGISAVGEDGEVRRAIEEEGLPKTAEEEAYWRTYTTCAAMIDSLERRRARSSNGHIATTAKDIRRIIRQTPPTYWEAIQDELMRRVREAKDTGRDQSFRYHRLVMLTYLLGMMISCGFRISETTHIRIGCDRKGRDRQYGPRNRKERRIELRACDRKNAKRHAAFLRERYCPVWLEEEYLERSRPFFLERGGADPHDWLLVDAQGRPYGCPEEDDQGNGRDDIAHARRVADLREYWIDQLMGVAADLGLEIPYEQGEFAPHVIRNVFGYLLYHTISPTAAASYLGDLVDSVHETYASCDGVHVDVSEAMVDGLGLIRAEMEGGDEAPSPPRPSTPTVARGGMSAELALLMQARNEGHISEELFVEAIADLQRRYQAA